MISIRLKKTILVLLGLFLLIGTSLSCGDDGGDNNLIFPLIVAVDSVNQRLFVVESKNNTLNLINAENLQVVKKENEDGDDVPILNEDDPKILPAAPTNAAVSSLEGGISRLFVIGANQNPSREIVVLDYDSVNGLRLSDISPIVVPGNEGDSLVGIKVDAERNLLLVTNASSGTLLIFDTLTGNPNANSPIEIGVGAGRLSVDLASDRLAISNSATNFVGFLNLLDLSEEIQFLNVGVATKDVALASNTNGTLLFISGSLQNTARVFNLNFDDIDASTLLVNLVAPGPNEENPEIINGSLNLTLAGNLSNGHLAGYYTQSSGDLLVVDFNQDLAGSTSTRVEIGAVAAQGIDALRSADQVIQSVYFVSLSVGTLSEIDPIDNALVDQVN